MTNTELYHLALSTYGAEAQTLMFNYWNFRKVIQKNIIEWRRYRSKEYRK